MRRYLLVVFAILYFALPGAGAFAADSAECRTACDTIKADCRDKASANFPNELDAEEPLKLCDVGLASCYDRCEAEKEANDLIEFEQSQKDRAEKELRDSWAR
jgi:hypothetical protein